MKKKPILAAILAGIFGPFGFLYLGWRYTVVALLVTIVFAVTATITGFDLFPWMRFLFPLVLAWKAYEIATIWNISAETDKEFFKSLQRFEGAAMATTELLVSMGIVYAISAGIYVSGRFLLEGKLLAGLFILFVATPILSYMAMLVLGFLAMILDAILIGGSTVNRLRNKSKVTAAPTQAEPWRKQA
jgi:MFS family permease